MYKKYILRKIMYNVLHKIRKDWNNFVKNDFPINIYEIYKEFENRFEKKFKMQIIVSKTNIDALIPTYLIRWVIKKQVYGTFGQVTLVNNRSQRRELY